MILIADQQIGNVAGVAAKHNGSGAQKTNMTGSDTGPQYGWDDLTVHTDSIANMRGRLGAINGAYYTTARLNAMSYNDMLYAIRLNDFPSTV